MTNTILGLMMSSIMLCLGIFAAWISENIEDRVWATILALIGVIGIVLILTGNLNKLI